VPLFAAAKAPLPAEIQVDHEQMGYDFYLVEVTFSSLLPPEQYLAKAELGLKISDDVKEPARRTRPVRLFPGRKDLNLFSVDLEGAVGLDAGMNFSIPMAGNQLLAFGKLTTDAKVKANLVAGPFHFQFRRAAIEVKGESDQLILWRYNLQSELRGTNDFKSVLVLKVSREARAVSLGVTLGVTRCQHRWLVFREHLPQLTDTQVLPVELVKP
jgi:hypothetical protein